MSAVERAGSGAFGVGHFGDRTHNHRDRLHDDDRMRRLHPTVPQARSMEPEPIKTRLDLALAWSSVRRSGSALWRSAKPARWQIAFFALAALFIAVIVRPWRPPGLDLSASDISRQWNESIAKLGIEPIFPPQEDIYVGDIYAILIDVDKSVDHTFLGTSVLLDHANVRWAFEAKDRDTPLFASTKAAGSDKAMDQDRGEVDIPAKYAGNPINLSLAAFPGVTITHSSNAGAKLGIGIGQGDADRDSSDLEQIHIPIAETYGISPPDAVSTLDQWCSAPETKRRCTREFALKMLASAAGDAFMRKKEGGTEPRVALIMVYRVYAAREFDIQRVRKGQVGGSLAATITPLPPSAHPAASDPDEKPDRATKGVAGDNVLRTSRTASSEEGVKQVFTRPVVFGFTSIKRGLSQQESAP